MIRNLFLSGLITGNTYIMKPSERDPTACMALVELLRDAGAPDGTVNVIHGQHDCVNFICDHPDIRAIRCIEQLRIQDMIVINYDSISALLVVTKLENTFTREDPAMGREFSATWEPRTME